MPAQDEPGQRLALIIASSDYRDPTLQQLRAPGHDASDLAGVLRDPTIGTFDVHTLINSPGAQLLRGIAQFCHQAGPGDLVLVYLSCHGVLDGRGRLYYATIDTERALLSATAVSAQWLSDQLDDCRARRQILLLDCCHSGAFARGGKGDDALALKDRFSGRGKVVLTASGSTEYSFEGTTVIGESVRSVFTRAVVDGLRTGQADRDKDGLITVDDLYHHVYDTVRAAEPRQTPELWTFGAQGDLLVAHSPRGRIIEPTRLPEYMRALIESSRPVVRESGVKVLADLLDHGEPGLALTARLTLQRISEEDLPRIAALARAAHDAGPRQAVTQVEAQERARQEAEEHAGREHAGAQRQKHIEQLPTQMHDHAAAQNWKTVPAVGDQLAALDRPPSTLTHWPAPLANRSRFSSKRNAARRNASSASSSRRPEMRDHDEVDIGPVAGVTDRGSRHHHNEDAMALTAEQTPDGPMVLAVVCDGIASSTRPDEASLAAAQAALPVLVAAVRGQLDLGKASLDAVAAARSSVAKLQGPSGDTSATTFLSVAAGGYEVTFCWLGDSRAYWLDLQPSQSRPLTQDDSVAGGMVVASETEAMASPHGYVLTRWLDGEAADLADDPDRSPHVERFVPPGAGALLLCSHGLWNYLPEAADLSKLALPIALTDPLRAAVDLVKSAVDAGGADNITAVLIPYLAPDAA